MRFTFNIFQEVFQISLFRTFLLARDLEVRLGLERLEGGEQEKGFWCRRGEMTVENRGTS